MTRHTRRNPSGPLLSPEKLAEVEKANRGKRANERWKQVFDERGPINEHNFDSHFAYYKQLTSRRRGRRGGRTRRYTRRR